MHRMTPLTPAYVNLCGDYRYLKEGYYKSLDAELKGMRVYPTCQEIIDAYTVPLCMQKARAAGIPIPKYSITNNYVEPPVIAYSLNPLPLYRLRARELKLLRSLDQWQI